MASMASNPTNKSKVIIRLKLSTWTPSEDARLRRLATEHGFRRWHRVSLGMPCRSAQACRRRWRDHIARSVYHRPFTAQDDAELAHLHRLLGGRWHDICEAVYCRSSRVLNHRWKELRRMGRLRREPPVRLLLPVATDSPPPPSPSPAPPPSAAQRSLDAALASAMSSCSLQSPSMARNPLDVTLASAMSFCRLH